MQLRDLMYRPVRTLSGRQARRLHVAVAMLHRPRLLLLDEPTAGVDIEMREALLQCIRHLTTFGNAVCYSTHHLREVELLAASVAILHEGRLIAGASLEERTRRHGEPALEIGSENPEAASAFRLAGRSVECSGLIVRVRSPEPLADLARIMAERGSATHGIHRVEVVRQGLEAIYLRLTGRRL